jgi:hypothetical protein
VASGAVASYAMLDCGRPQRVRRQNAYATLLRKLSLRFLSVNRRILWLRLRCSYFTAPNVNPRTSCFCVSHPSTMMGATARNDAAESFAQKRPSGLE